MPFGLAVALPKALTWVVGWGLVTTFVPDMLSVLLSFLDCFGLTVGGGK